MKTVWEKADAKTISAIMTFGDEYRSFLGKTKTEREFVKEARALAEAKGFKDLATKKGKLKAGDKVYAVNRNKNLCLFVIGKKPLTDGLNILGAHIDSPRLDLKQHPIYEKDGLVLLDTHYYGGIKKYQWVARPMALHGVVCKTDGTTVEICIGEKADDPVVGISDLLIHLAAEQMKKPASTVVEGEALNVLAGSIPMKGAEKDPVKAYLLDLLKKQYDIEEDDFVSAEIEVVPAEAPRDYGLDRSMVLGYGHDDRVCAYTSMRAILEMKKPERTSCCILVDKEEIGSVGATG
ncbi:MAG: aminopeptidase, partial [Solobacterium sp.]|nr:aminopeptidase [Solobacterium sp.]